MTRRANWWQWPTVLSIDAPVVAVSWQLLLARVAGVELGWPAPAVLALSVWLAYVADRWIEGWRLDADVMRTPRHHFYQRYRWPMAFAWLAAFVVDVMIAFARLSRADLIGGFVLIAAVAAYLLSHQHMHRHQSWRAPKELCVAALLTGGVFVFLTQTPRISALTSPVVLFALLCFTNCALISVWESDVDRAHGQTSLALDDVGNARLIRQLPWMIAVLAVVAAVTSAGAGMQAELAAGASGLLLAVVDRIERAAGWQPARVLADLALMTPVAALLLPLVARG